MVSDAPSANAQSDGAARARQHLSVVAVSRNDDHGGDLRGRMQLFVDGFVAQCRRHSLDAELILVEWNPPPGKPPLVDALNWPDDLGPASIRIITVPPEVHAQFAHASQLPLFQMIGKNVGIRRARGRFVLATNVDILLDDATVRHLRDRLRPGTMLRVDRYDVPGDLPLGTPFERVLAECARRFFYVNTRLGIFDVRRRRILGLGTDGISNIVHLVTAMRILGVQRSRLWSSLRRAVDAAAAAPRRASVRLYRRFADIVHLVTAMRIQGVQRSRLWSSLRHAVDAAAAALRRAPIRLYRFTRTIVVVCASGAPVGHATRGLLARPARLVSGLASYLTARLGWASPRSVRYHRSRWLHTNACGDFTLLAREDWARLRGYPEWPIFSWHLDSAFMYAASANGVCEVALDTRYRTYHLDHSRGSGWSPSGAAQLFARLDAKGIAYLSNGDLESWRRRVAADPGAAIVNGPSWGLVELPLPERQIVPRMTGAGCFRNALQSCS